MLAGFSNLKLKIPMTLNSDKIKQISENKINTATEIYGIFETDVEHDR